MTPTVALPALIQSHVDAWVMWNPGLAIAEVDHHTRRIASGDAAPHYGVIELVLGKGNAKTK